MDSILAFDLGGTDLKVALVSREGEARDFTRVPSRASEGEAAMLAAVRAVAATFAARDGMPISGFGSPGVLHPETGAIVDVTPNLRLPPDYPMRARLETLLARRVVIDNDANCAALAEHRAGAAKGARVSLTVTVGTGVGCGIVVDGQVVRGAFGGAGEIGHLPLGSEGPQCGCGVVGCAEPMAGGGGVSQAGDELFVPLAARVRRYMLRSHAQQLRIVPAMLGESAGVIGAGLAAWQVHDRGTERRAGERRRR